MGDLAISNIDIVSDYAKGGEIKHGVYEYIELKGIRFEKNRGYTIRDDKWNDLINKGVLPSKDINLAEDWRTAIKEEAWGKYTREMYSPKLDRLREQTENEFYNNKVYAKGGKMQGYDDRLDESLSMRDGAGRKKQQSKKDRRDESAGMEKSMGRRKYASVGTMDKVKTLPKPAKDFIAYVIDMAGNTTLKYSKTFQGANRMMQNMLKKNQDVSTHGVSKYDPFYGTRVGKMFFEPIKGFAKGGMTEHGLEIGDKIIKEKDNSVLVVTKDEKNASIVNLDKGIRANFEKGGETDFIQQVVDSPDFRKGAFTKKAKSRDLTTEEFMKKVLKNPDKYDERTRKQAQFMKNITS